MAESDKAQNFWTTLPGLLTGLAALLTAVTGLLLIFHPHSATAGKESPPAAVSSTNEQAEPAKVAPAGSEGSVPAPSAPSKQQKQQDPGVLVVEKDGTSVQVHLKGFKNSMFDQAIRLKSGQSVPFEKIKSIDFQGERDYDRDISVTLTSGQVLQGSIQSGEQFSGETDIGPFSVPVRDLKLVSFER